MQQQEYYDQTQYDGSQYAQNYDTQYDQYGVDPNAGYTEQYENYEEPPTSEQVNEEQIEEVQENPTQGA